ncbi:MAG: RNA pyrophosphohydrolase [Alphaproteobacteria bacterium]|nr:RNA pyrophosphohydrolase [Alphaproteobacteria bacterium]
MHETEEGIYRSGVGTVLARPNRMVFAGRRIQNFSHEAWQLPQGGIDPEEDIEKAMWRELAEETGVGEDHARIVGVTDWLYYDIPKKFRRKLWQGQYVGQRQKWFLLEFLAEDAAVSLENPGVPAEFDAWKWVPFDHVDAIAIAFKRALYRKVQKAFWTEIDRIV